MAKKDGISELAEKLELKFDKIESRLDSMDQTLVRNTVSLEEHVRRTNMAELAIADVRNDIEPLKKHKAFMEGALKGVGLLAIVVSVAAGILEIVSFFIRH